MTMRAVQFGAGNIGRGFMGQLLFEAGYHTTFVDVQEDLLGELDAAGEYTVRIVGDGARDIAVTNFDTCLATNPEALSDVIVRADVLATAVGESAFDPVIRSIASGLETRLASPDAKPINIILCENIPGAAKRAAALLNVDDTRVGIVEASIGRMVPVMTAEQRAEAPLRVCVEGYNRLPVDGAAIRGEVPALPTLECHTPFQAIIDRKLFVHNMSHAAAAYLGYLRGHEYIWQAIGDSVVREAVEAAMHESAAALTAVYDSSATELEAHCDDLLRRYANRDLGDQVSRVGRDPIRKLGQADRLIGAMRLCERAGTTYGCIAVAAAAAMLYDPSDDPSAPDLQRFRREEGDAQALARVSGIPADSEMTDIIIRRMDDVRTKFTATES